MDDNFKDNLAASGKAIAVFVLGILSLLCMGFVTGVPAILIGLGELKAIKEGKSSRNGESLTKAGLVLGIIGTSISVVAVIIATIFIALGMSIGLASIAHNAFNG